MTRYIPLVLLASAAFGSSVGAQEVGRVISSMPIIQQVAVPRQVCTQQQVATQPRKSGAGSAMGAIAGGVVGNAIGKGEGNALATAIGVIGGAILGDKIEGSPPAEVQNVQTCSTQTFMKTAPWPTTWFTSSMASSTTCKCPKTQVPLCACKSPP
jgi:uncharacterized protein YcfJ